MQKRKMIDVSCLQEVRWRVQEVRWRVQGARMLGMKGRRYKL